jgi:alpha-methylacyl-CoA racemase
MSDPLPLAGIQIVDLSNAGPGPRCSRILADLGAAVIRVAPPAGQGGHRVEMADHAYGAGRGWRKLAIDLKDDRGHAVLARLLETADVLIEGFRPGVAARLRLGYEDVRCINSRLIYCSISSYGQTGPAANSVGHDLNYVAMSGMLAMGGHRSDGAPAIPGLTVADTSSGMQAAICILGALLRRSSLGTGCYLDVSATDAMLHLMSLYVDEYLATGIEPKQGTSVLTGKHACYDTYETLDGHWLSVAAIEKGFFATLCDALGCPHRIPEQYDNAKQHEIRVDFKKAFASRTRADWLEVLGPLDTCVAPVNSIADVVMDPHFTARGAFGEALDPSGRSRRQVGNIYAASFGVKVSIPPTERADYPAILSEIGISSAELAALEQSGVVG